MRNVKERKVNILVVNQFASLPHYYYGPGERMYHLSEYLASENYNIKVVSGAYNHLFKKFPDCPEVYNVEKSNYLDFIWVKLKRYRKESFSGRVYSWFEFLFKLFRLKLTEKPEVILVSSLSLLPILYALWIKRKYHSKFILEIRDIWPLTPIELGGFSRYNPFIIFLRKVEILGYRNADHIVSVLPGFGKYLIDNKFGSKPFTWIPNGVSEKRIDITTENNAYNILNQKKFNVLYAGTFGTANALETLIEAASLLHSYEDIHITLLGDGPLEEELKALSKKNSNVSFIPKVLKSEVHGILKEADVCYMGWHDKRLYKYGVAANKLNDYMLAKRPILSSSTIESDPVILANAGIQVGANDAKIVANGIVKLFEMTEQERKELGMNGYKFVIENQIYPVLAKKYLAVLNAVINETN